MSLEITSDLIFATIVTTGFLLLGAVQMAFRNKVVASWLIAGGLFGAIYVAYLKNHHMG